MLGKALGATCRGCNDPPAGGADGHTALGIVGNVSRAGSESPALLEIEASRDMTDCREAVRTSAAACSSSTLARASASIMAILRSWPPPCRMSCCSRPVSSAAHASCVLPIPSSAMPSNRTASGNSAKRLLLSRAAWEFVRESGGQHGLDDPPSPCKGTFRSSAGITLPQVPAHATSSQTPLPCRFRGLKVPWRVWRASTQLIGCPLYCLESPVGILRRASREPGIPGRRHGSALRAFCGRLQQRRPDNLKGASCKNDAPL
jgi:hypothetical protein